MTNMGQTIHYLLSSAAECREDDLGMLEVELPEEE